MIKNLGDYFIPQHEFYLNEVKYKRISNQAIEPSYSLNVTDNVSVDANDETIQINVERILSFVPEGLFDLSVSFGAILHFNEDRKNEIDWNSVILAEEFVENGQFVMNNLMSRISMLIAEITASYGQAPIVLPNAVIKEIKD